MSMKDYRSHQQESQLLKEGDSKVILRSFLECTSFDDVRFIPGSGLGVIGLKAMTNLWNTPTTQYAILVSNAEGCLVHRMNGDSWLHWDDPQFTNDMRDSGQYTEVGGYVCHMVNEKLERVPNAQGTLRCDNIIQSFLFAITNGIPDVPGDKAVDSAIANAQEFVVHVVKQPYKGTTQLRIDAFKPLSKVNAVVEEPVEEDDLRS